MRDALNASGRPILFSACEWAVDFPATWMAPVANSCRVSYSTPSRHPKQTSPPPPHTHTHTPRYTVPLLGRATYDIQNLWECVVPHVDWVNVYADYAA